MHPRCCEHVGVVRMAAVTGGDETRPTCNPEWTDDFFDEQNIVSTFQHLLHGTAHSVEDLCRLCVTACEDHVVLALNLHGLIPFANNPEFMIPFANMSQRQLQALRRDCKKLPDAMACEYDVDAYVLKIPQVQFQIDHSLLLFAAAVLLYKGLSQTKVCARGFCSTFLAHDPELLAQHANSILFQIVHSCSVRRGALRAATRLLHKHGVST
jgi:hypothetical protein